MFSTGRPRGLASLSPSPGIQGIPGFPVNPITQPTVGDLWESLQTTRAVQCCEDLIFSLTNQSLDDPTDEDEDEEAYNRSGDNAVDFMREHIKYYGGGDEATDAFFAFLSAFKSNDDEELEYTSSIAKSIRQFDENRELKAQVVSLEQQLCEACAAVPTVSVSEAEQVKKKQELLRHLEKGGAKMHGLPQGSKTGNASGSFWSDNNDCITGVGGGKRSAWKESQIGDMCPTALLIKEDPTKGPNGEKLWICQCQR
jgi:hypothetical protein